jgi:uncharacterized alkaline shock family protein YloU
MTQYLIATSVLESIVRGALESDQRVRVHTPLPLVRTRAVEIAVEGEQCFVAVQLDARMGEHLPSMAGDVRRAIAGALGSMTGLRVASVDVSFSGVFPVGV